MEGAPGNVVEQHVDWADPRHGVVEYQQLEGAQIAGTSSFDGSVSAGSQFAGLQSLQGVFVTIQTSTEDNAYQSLQNDVGYQSVYMTGGSTATFERISPDVDYTVTADDEGLALDGKQQFIQVPFIIGGHSQSPDGSGSQYCTVLNSYLQNLQNLGSSVVNANLAASSVNTDGLSLQSAVSSTVTSHDRQSLSAPLIQMMTPSFPQSGLNAVHTSVLVGDSGVQDGGQSLSNAFNGGCSSSYLQLSLDSGLNQRNTLSSNAGCDTVALSTVIGSSGVQDAGEVDVLQQLLADGDDGVDDIESTNSLEISNNDVAGNEGSELVGTRKSARLANRDHVTSPVPSAKYVSKPYSTLELWCEDCQKSYSEECPKHKLQPLADKIVLSRAWASLPPNLQIFRLVQSANETISEMGVFAKRLIPARTQFGPFIAPTVSHPDLLTCRKFLLLVDRDNGSSEYYDPADENQCNWMMFVRPASAYSEQNLVAYQFRNDIYFSTITNVQPGQELKIWYAAHYAERLQIDLLQKPEEAAAVLDNVDLPWSCYECSERFRTAALLQNHLSIHDDEIPVPDDSVADDPDDPECSKQRRSRKRPGIRPPDEDSSQLLAADSDNLTAASSGASEQNEFQSWKKKKTNMYLKMKKYKEPIKRSIRTLTGKSKTGVIGICCSQCDLVFEKQELLQVHMYTHMSNVLCGDPLTAGGLPVTQRTGESSTGIVQDTGNNTITCPSCPASFGQISSLACHVASHSIPRRHRGNNRNISNNVFARRRPYKCLRCWKAFDSEEKLRRHMLSHTDNLKPLKCDVCDQRFMNNSALSCHKKIHSNQKYYNCPLCHEGFDQINMLRAHAERHLDPATGVFSCPWCHKSFDTFASARRHARAFHSLTTYTCPDCGKSFPRPDKLKLHRLRHSSHREFMCETCGRQFKRKDKLREHVKRAHDPNSPKPSVGGAAKSRSPGGKSFDNLSRFAAGPRVTPSDYEKFFFKCHDCQLGFKRRGMLINHMAKRHPEIPLNSIRELNEPIMRSQRDFYCQYCDKVYKSSSKRKAHITKSHPGAELPAGAKRRGGSLGPDDSSLPNPTYSATVGNVLSSPHGCEFCHKQYSTKAKLLQHRRSKHPAEAERGDSALIQLQTTKVIVDAGGNSAASKVLMISRHVNGAEIQFIPQNAAGVSSAVAAGELTDPDILTQAMTELTQFGVIAAPSLGASEYHTIVPCVVNMPPGTALVQSLTGVDHEPAYATTIIQHGQQAETDPTVVSSSAYHQGQNMNWNVLTGGSSFQAF